MPKFPIKSTVRVRFAETDGAGIVFHANYFVYFEVARMDYYRGLGLDLKKWGEKFQIVLAEADCRFKAPARFEDLLEVSTRVSEIKTSSFRMEYQIDNPETQKRIAEGFTVHVFLDPKTWKPKNLPLELIQKVKRREED